MLGLFFSTATVDVYRVKMKCVMDVNISIRTATVNVYLKINCMKRWHIGVFVQQLLMFIPNKIRICYLYYSYNILILQGLYIVYQQMANNVHKAIKSVFMVFYHDFIKFCLVILIF